MLKKSLFLILIVSLIVILATNCEQNGEPSPSPKPPNAVAKANPTNGQAPLAVQFKGSDSTDPDGTIVSYAWTFGDGGTSNVADPAHTYNTAGTYNAKLTVTDNDGKTDDDTVTVTVTANGGGQPPNAVATADVTSGPAPLTVHFTGSGSTDPDGTIVSYAWTFNDGGTSNIADPTHTYNTAGNYTATLTVTDNDGLQDTATIPITVTAAPAREAAVWVVVGQPGSGYLLKYSIDGNTKLKEVGGLNNPYDVDVDLSDGSVWVSESTEGGSGGNSISKYSVDGTKLFTKTPGFNSAWGVAVDSSDGSCWVADHRNYKVWKFDKNGNTLKQVGGFSFPRMLDVNPSDGSVWVAEFNGKKATKLDKNGNIVTSVTGFTYYAEGININPNNGRVWVAARDVGGGQVATFGPNGGGVNFIGGFKPRGVGADPGDDTAWVADYFNHRVVKIDATGTQLHTLGALNTPYEVAVNPDDRTAWISDVDGKFMVKVSSTCANLKQVNLASYGWPQGIAVDPGHP